MKKIISFVKKYPKDLCITIAVILIGFLAVSADGFSDFAETKFWWNFWSVVHVVAILTFVGGWVYFVRKDRRSNDL